MRTSGLFAFPSNAGLARASPARDAARAPRAKFTEMLAAAGVASIQQIGALFNRLSVLPLSLLLMFELLAGPSARATEVWLGPQSPKRAVDFLDMFTPDAPWTRAAAHVNVFKLYEGYLISAPQDHVDNPYRAGGRPHERR